VQRPLGFWIGEQGGRFAHDGLCSNRGGGHAYPAKMDIPASTGDGTCGEGQLWIARPARGSDDKRRTPSIVNGRRSVSTFPALPARWSAEIVESNVDFSVKSPACHAGATPLIAVAALRALVTPSEGGDDSPAAAGTALHRLSVSDLPGNGPPQRRIGSVRSKNKALDQSCPNRDQTLSSERPADSPLFSGNVPTLKANCWRNKL